MPILFADYQGICCPISNTYHATASRHLSSYYTVLECREVDSTYCPQCLNFHDTLTSLTRPTPSSTKLNGGTEFVGRCTSQHCKQCPVCFVPLSIVCVPQVLEPEKTVLLYKCGYCRYNSGDECDLQVSTKSDLHYKMGVENLDQLYHGKVSQNNTSSGLGISLSLKIFDELLRGWNIKVKEDKANKSYSVAHAKKNHTVSLANGWNLETLESTRDLKNQILTSETSVISVHFKNNLISQNRLDEPEKFLNLSAYLEQTTLFPVVSTNLCPHRLQLCTKLSKRCPLEMARGKPGILVKPKMNPLDGDTSQRTGQGKWFKKDCSAIHTVPKLSLIKRHITSAPERHIINLLIKVHNPTLGSVRLRLCKHGTTAEETPESFVIDSILLNGYTLDTASQILVLGASSVNLCETSEWIELEPAQDSIIDFSGSLPHAIQKELHGWDGAIATQSFVRSHEKASFRLVAKAHESAWFEYIVSSTLLNSDAEVSKFMAVPLALQIEVGKGSWQSSFIRSETPINGDEDIDIVELKTLVVWDKSSQD